MIRNIYIEQVNIMPTGRKRRSLVHTTSAALLSLLRYRTHDILRGIK